LGYHLQTVAARPTRPALRARYDRRRDEVVGSSARIFAEHGYAETSVSELAARLGLATGALYHYFQGKEELLIEICDQLMEPLLAASRELLAADSSSATDQLRDLVRLWVSHVVAHRDHLLVFTQVRHVVDHGEQWRGVRRSRKEFEQLLAEALDEAEVANAELARYALLGMVNHTVQWYRPRGPLVAEQIADGYVELIVAPARSRVA
jgi:TetR/AcrR family transcriptional regulator, cholesterol catabolism regulator